MTLTEALFKLRDAGKLHRVYLPGMLYRTPEELKRIGDGGIVFVSDLRQWEPDLTDPATLGCLLALIREASGRPIAYAHCTHGSWVVYDHPANPALGSGWTEGLALDNALVRLAEGL